MREDDLLSRLEGIFAAVDPSVLVGPGPDDCAHLEADGRRLAVSTDAFAEGSHFPPGTPAGAVAYKALAASVSDLAASACRARWALVCLSLRRGMEASWAEDFARGLAGAAGEFGVSVVGGDTISSPAGLFVAVTALGEPLPGGPILRGGARPGDILVVTGALGGSSLGRHLCPCPRLREIRTLMQFCRESGDGVFPSAGMDVSDGLSLDLHRLCRESGVGAEIDAASIPLSPDALRAAGESGQSPLRHALADGEDFELLLALPPGLWKKFNRRLAGPAAFTAIGRITEGKGLILREADGRTRPLPPQGYQHQW
ncbi:MAG: thiamine-phosphate kinase [Planctomycetota bacterium]|nr:thiamine-phosphate kinase [Planctomycetota bacterium]